jgi:membrane-associated HD superfamily phosphohydrolase
LKLFKPQAPRPPRNGAAAPSDQEKLPAWRTFLQNPFFQMTIFVLLLAYFMSYVPSRRLPAIMVGDIARTDIISPIDLTVEDAVTTSDRRRQAAEAVLPVYVLDRDAFLNTEERIRQVFQAGKPGACRTRPREKQLMEQHGREILACDLESWPGKFRPAAGYVHQPHRGSARTSSQEPLIRRASGFTLIRRLGARERRQVDDTELKEAGTCLGPKCQANPSRQKRFER